MKMLRKFITIWRDSFFVLEARTRKARKLVESIKNDYEPIVSDNILVQFSKVEEVYSKCVHWLNNRGAVIFEEDYPGYILAFEVGKYRTYEGYHENIPDDVLNWPKFFKFNLSKNGVNVDILIEIYQGWKKLKNESYEKRKFKYPWIILEFKKYIA